MQSLAAEDAAESVHDDINSQGDLHWCTSFPSWPQKERREYSKANFSSAYFDRFEILNCWFVFFRWQHSSSFVVGRLYPLYAYVT